ncbi:hypothetical protein BDA96_03G200100 [Sorghum bicolor]|uniref:F-box domain-containing protein n=2 Tax=Sorghum bicolor TaxID=4558 RepID=A0A921RDT9_SORBI|nr:hypothetical protein BDA96_03G200100 [Sorghum bicolor]OQU86989.1 hypothetical protein SORBI_3003G184666 [Sorghum bicolor]
MPRGRTVKGAVQQPAGGSGGIESLPDGVLEHILGFLPSAEAVRTSMLARRWRHRDPDQQLSVEDLWSLVNHLLVNLWFRHVVTCKVHVLSLVMFGHSAGEPRLELDNLPLISQHLRWLELTAVQVHKSLLIFSNCPALDHLKIVDYKLSSVNKIVSESLKHIYLVLSVGCWTTALMQIIFWTCDYESCDSSDSTANGSINCVLLRGLSEANSLALKSVYGMWFGDKVQIKLRVSSMKRATAISEHLKKVEIKCQKVHDTVLKVLKFLCAFNIWFVVEMIR